MSAVLFWSDHFERNLP